MEKPHKQPKDLKVEINTREGIKWEDTLAQTEEALALSKVNAQIQETVIELAKRRAKEEKEKLK